MSFRGLAQAIHLGDMAGCRSRKKWVYTRSILLKAATPWFWTIGNHEIMSCGTGKLRQQTVPYWINFWLPGSKRSYYTHNLGNWVMIHLDTAYAIIGREQLEWLEGVLRPEKRYLIFLHRPPPHPQKRRAEMDAMPPGSRNARLWRILKANSHKIIAIMHGHDHRFLKYKLDDIDVYCTGGGGGQLQNRHEWYHYLIVTLTEPLDVQIVWYPKK